jgi:acetyl-CoA synthetase (ADP-forming)
VNEDDVNVNSKPFEISNYLTEVMKDQRNVLTLEESRKVFEHWGIPVNKSSLATTVEEAVKQAGEIGFPVVMKIVSPQVIHKTEVGGVRVNVNSEDEVRKIYSELIDGTKQKMPEAEITGVLIEEMVKGTEFIIGTTEDPQFGQMIMFGVGGIFVEVYKDVSFRLIPITTGDAYDMLEEIKGKALLTGVRGLPEADSKQLVNILMKVSELVKNNPEIKEMDINPLMITNTGAVAADARILLNKKKEE